MKERTAIADSERISQSADALCYRLVQGPVDLQPLRVLAARCIKWGRWRVTFCVLGASHAVRFERAGIHLTELLTCAPPIGAPHVLAEQNGNMPAQFCRTAAGIACHACLAPFALTEGDALHGVFPPTNRLEVAYPSSPSASTPFTRLGWRLTTTTLEIETVHTYPEERQGVRSKTRFTQEAI